MPSTSMLRAAMAIALLSICGPCRAETVAPMDEDLVRGLILGHPTMDSPVLLEGNQSPATYAFTHDGESLDSIHGDFEDCDMAFYSLGSFEPLLEALWQRYMADFNASDRLRNAFFMAGEPPPLSEIGKGFFQSRNLRIHCRPQVVIGTRQYMRSLEHKHLLIAKPQPFARSSAYALLVKRGNPKKIRGIADLGRRGVAVVTSNPQKEPSYFLSMVRLIYILGAKNDGGLEDPVAKALVGKIFGSKAAPGKWLTSNDFAHRGVPWSIAKGRGDVSLLPYQMAKIAKEKYPGLFDIVELDEKATTKRLQLELWGYGKMFVAQLTGTWTSKQRRASEALVELLLSPEFTKELEKYRIVRFRD